MFALVAAPAILIAAVGAGEPDYVQREEQFVAAINNDSTNTYFVLVTVTDGRTQQTKSGCVTANLLLGAIHREYRLDYDEASVAKARRLALASNQNRFTFKSRGALANIGFDEFAKQDQVVCELVRAGFTAYRADVSGQIVTNHP